MKFRSSEGLKFAAILLSGSLLFSGCVMRIFSRKKEKKEIPQMLFFPFACDNFKIGDKITKGFLDEVDKKVEILDLAQFKLLLSSNSLSMDIYLPVERRQDVFDPDLIYKSIVRKESVRKEFYADTGIEYVIMGNAEEKILTELELGNLKTAEKAEMKMFDMENGGALLDEKFKQGFFEVLQPERIGSKFAAKVNGKLKAIRKAQKKKLKAERKKAKGG